MKPYSQDLRAKIVSAIENGESSFRKTAQRFSVSQSCVQKLVAQKADLVVNISASPFTRGKNKFKQMMIADIARHHNLKMKPEDAGDAREMLERLEVVYIKQGGKPDEQGTYIMPDYGTIDNVIALIRSGDIRVSPPGFYDSILKSAAVMDSAIDALPGVTR